MIGNKYANQLLKTCTNHGMDELEYWRLTLGSTKTWSGLAVKRSFYWVLNLAIWPGQLLTFIDSLNWLAVLNLIDPVTVSISEMIGAYVIQLILSDHHSVHTTADPLIPSEQRQAPTTWMLNGTVWFKSQIDLRNVHIRPSHWRLILPDSIDFSWLHTFFRTGWLTEFWIIQFNSRDIGLSDWLTYIQFQFNIDFAWLLSDWQHWFNIDFAWLTESDWIESVTVNFCAAAPDWACGWRLWRQWIVTFSFHHRNSNCRSPSTWCHLSRMDQLPFWTMSWQPYGFTILTLSARWTNICIPWKWPRMFSSHRQWKTGPIIGQPGTQFWAVHLGTTCLPPMPLSIGSCWTLLRPQTLWSTSATHSAHLAIVTTVSWQLVTCPLPSSSTSSAVTWQRCDRCAGTWIASATTLAAWINAWQIWWSRWLITCQIWPQTLAWVTTEAWPDRWKWALPQLSSDKLPSSHRHSQFVWYYILSSRTSVWL